jgi:hypothetical protein
MRFVAARTNIRNRNTCSVHPALTRPTDGINPRVAMQSQWPTSSTPWTVYPPAVLVVPNLWCIGGSRTRSGLGDPYSGRAREEKIRSWVPKGEAQGSGSCRSERLGRFFCKQAKPDPLPDSWRMAESGKCGTWFRPALRADRNHTRATVYGVE